MAVLNFLVGWFNGMGWPPCGRVMTHWFSIKERGTWMSIWNCAHNVGGALVGPMAVYGAIWFGNWFYGADEQRYFLRSEEHTSELQSRQYLVCRLLLEKKKNKNLKVISSYLRKSKIVNISCYFN